MLNIMLGNFSKKEQLKIISTAISYTIHIIHAFEISTLRIVDVKTLKKNKRRYGNTYFTLRITINDRIV